MGLLNSINKYSTWCKEQIKGNKKSEVSTSNETTKTRIGQNIIIIEKKKWKNEQGTKIIIIVLMNHKKVVILNISKQLIHGTNFGVVATSRKKPQAHL